MYGKKIKGKENPPVFFPHTAAAILNRTSDKKY